MSLGVSFFHVPLSFGLLKLQERRFARYRDLQLDGSNSVLTACAGSALTVPWQDCLSKAGGKPARIYINAGLAVLVGMPTPKNPDVALFKYSQLTKNPR